MSKKFEALAATLNMDYDSAAAFVREYAYQPGRHPDKVFTRGGDYYVISKKMPKSDVGGPWYPIKDQFWAEKLGLTIWVSEAT
jgi:hypothetical protein